MTQEEKIIREMIRLRQRVWFYPPDFMQSGMGTLFVGYEASARLSELAADYPLMIESQRRGKYKERRIRYEAIGEWWEIIPENLRIAFAEAGIGPSKVVEL